MIVVSLLLILVAVILLVLGLAAGSSGLLISSIVASLLAAVALVVGARQAAAGRRAVGEPLTADPDDIQPAEPFAGTGRRRPAEPDPAEAFLAAQSRTSAASERSAAAADDLYGEPPGDVRTEDESSGDRFDDALDNGLDDEETRTASGRDAAYAAGQRDTEAALTGASRTATGPDVTQRIEPDTEPAGTPGDAGADHVPYSGTDTDRTAARAPQGADYDQASSVIGGARAEDDDSWRRARGEEAENDGPGRAGAPAASEPAGGFASAPDSRSAAGGFGSATDPEGPAGGFGPASDSRSAADGFGPAADSGAVAGSGAAAGEFGEPDPDDPDDEPPPQRVRPADAVRVARMDAEVVVVDGRPRYHLADCPHLPGRSTEALPVAEAVELGFSPCGLCRPVDRLVAAATRS
ncbi:hypothetical protein COUCH_29630 [Couchioplanes caeruleus]|uniref:hypothetical protein n=1 Tax=Couchioplanes caeruleus TaxID=56438 RepID=UPI0020C12056|nr:hypothetical protein [Couchioplanes caeruleus]UQU68789.1 hypothetical protein COUCH_29630 [Couchioplanes caeruleus]